MVNSVTKTEVTPLRSSQDNHNFVQNGDFASWSKGEAVEGKGTTTIFADNWFGRRGNMVCNITATKIALPSGNAMRISRKEGDLNTNNWAVAQIIDVSEFPYLADKTILFSARVRAGADYSSHDKTLKILVDVSFDSTRPNLNPYSLGQNSQSVAVLPIKLKQQWREPILSGKIHREAKFIMVRILSETLEQVPAGKNDFVEISDVELKIDYENETENQNKGQTIPIFHVASMARSGETVFLRCLAAHPKICNLVNVEVEEQDEKLQLCQYLQQYRHSRISYDHPLVKRLNLEQQKLVLVKQGTWEHKYPFNGLVLVRNPISIYASLISYGLKGKNAEIELQKRKQNAGSSKNFLRWMGDIDESIMDYYQDLNYLDQFCTLYNRRMYPLSQLGLPIVHYESFCQYPQQYLGAILRHFSLDYDRSVLNSHSQYESNQKGHGLIDLSSPVNTKSLDKWKNYVSSEEFNRIASLTCNTWQAFGYELNPTNITVKSSYRWIDAV